MTHTRTRIRTKLKSPGVALACLGAVALLVGCGNPKLGDVRGVITLDGKPLPDAFVRFVPVNEGASSFGKTASDGSYRMKFSDKENGAFIGSNHVVIGTGDVKADNSGSTPELVPNVYNDKTTLIADVKKGRNTFDFDLKSDASRIEKVEMD